MMMRKKQEKEIITAMNYPRECGYWPVMINKKVIVLLRMMDDLIDCNFIIYVMYMPALGPYFSY